MWPYVHVNLQPEKMTLIPPVPDLHTPVLYQYIQRMIMNTTLAVSFQAMRWLNVSCVSHAHENECDYSRGYMYVICLHMLLTTRTNTHSNGIAVFSECYLFLLVLSRFFTHKATIFYHYFFDYHHSKSKKGIFQTRQGETLEVFVNK